MSYRIFMTIDRGPMDKTLVCVYPWEKPIVEEVHGGAAQEVSIEELTSLKGAVKVEQGKLPIAEKNRNKKTQPGLTLRQQLDLMVSVDPEEDPIHALEAEWGRLIDRYGMHRNVNMPTAEKVYGNFTNFRRVALQYRGSKPPAEEVQVGHGHPADDAGTGEKAPADMTRAELVAALKKEGVAFNKKATEEELRELLTLQIA